MLWLYSSIPSYAFKKITIRLLGPAKRIVKIIFKTHDHATMLKTSCSGNKPYIVGNTEIIEKIVNPIPDDPMLLNQKNLPRNKIFHLLNSLAFMFQAIVIPINWKIAILSKCPQTISYPVWPCQSRGEGSLMTTQQTVAKTNWQIITDQNSFMTVLKP